MMAYAAIHHYDYSLGETNKHTDGYGDELLGYYYEIFDDEGKQVTGLMGPYNSKADVEAACEADWAHR